jgi:hypothetical protein
MTEQLPISIDACDELVQQYTKIISVNNKLEAQFNFQTMTANWYGDEDNILFVKLFIETPARFILQKNELNDNNLQHYSDDAFSYLNNREKEQMLICHVAITETELTLLENQPKLLAGLLQVKLQKVLNLIAKQLQLDAI